MNSPSPRGTLLADSVESTKAIVARFLAGFDERTALHQAPGLPNHVCWSLGHLALTMHRAIEKINGAKPPSSDFLEAPAANGHKGSRERGYFDAEAVSFGSSPSADSAQYPTMARSVEIFNRAVDQLASTVRSLDDAALDREIAWGVLSLKMPVWSLVVRMVFHNGFHTGQITDTRRALGFKSAFS